MSGRVRAGEKRSGSALHAYFADLAELRGAEHGLLGSLFLYPAEEEIAELTTAAGRLRRMHEVARGFPFWPPLRDVLDGLENMSDEAREELGEEYVDLFLAGASPAPCPPYESAYVGGGTRMGLVGVQVERAYAGGGFGLASPGELPDHVALELAFLSLLCCEEAHGWRTGEIEPAAGWLEHERAFHERHLQRWLPVFARRLSLATAPTSFYRKLAQAVHAFVVHDRGLIEALLGVCSVDRAVHRGSAA